MRIIPIQELQVILEEHRLWLYSDGEEGKRADLSYTDLSYTDLSCINLSYAYLSNSDLSNSDLSHTDLSHADLYQANFHKANLYCSCLSQVYLDNIKNKEIITFQANKHFAYYCDGYIKIGCMCMCVKEWIEQYEEIGREEGYTDENIKIYGAWIKLIEENCNENCK